MCLHKSPIKTKFSTDNLLNIIKIINSIYMSRKLLIIAMAIIALASCRTLTPEEKAAKAQKEAVEHKLDSVKFQSLKASILNKSFVLEADVLMFKRGQRADVNRATNFIAVSGDKASVQVAPFNGGGPNGVGGITVDGNMSNFETKTDNRGNVSVKFFVSGTAVSANVSLTLMKNSSRASAYISPSFNSQNLTLEGNLVPLDNSSVFKGRAW